MINKRQLASVSLVFVLGIGLGIPIGGWLGFRRGSFDLVESWVRTNARDGAGMVDALTLLRTGHAADGMENLETHLNRLLVLLSPPYMPEGFEPREATGAALHKTRESARDYRQRYPRPPSQRLLDREVADFLGTTDSTRK